MYIHWRGSPGALQRTTVQPAMAFLVYKMVLIKGVLMSVWLAVAYPQEGADTQLLAVAKERESQAINRQSFDSRDTILEGQNGWGRHERKMKHQFIATWDSLFKLTCAGCNPFPLPTTNLPLNVLWTGSPGYRIFKQVILKFRLYHRQVSCFWLFLKWMGISLILSMSAWIICIKHECRPRHGFEEKLLLNKIWSIPRKFTISDVLVIGTF